MKRSKLKKYIERIALLSAVFFLYTDKLIIHAKGEKGGKLANSDFGEGLKKLLEDASAYLLILSPIAGGLFAIYFFIRKNAADDQDQKAWNKKLITTGICVVGAVIIASVITVLTGYFTVEE